MKKNLLKLGLNEKQACALRNIGIILVGVLALLLLFGTASTALWIVDDDYVEFMKIQNTVVAESSGDITSKTLAVKSAALKEEWNKTFGGTYDDLASSVQQTADGGYIFVRQPESQDAGFNDTGLVKTDSNGNEQWNKTFGRTDKDFANSVKQTTDGGYIIAGGMVSYSTGYYDARLMKTDSNGNEQWNKTFGGTRNDVAYSVQQTTDGGYIIAGGTESYGAGSIDAWLVKIDSNGNKQWDKTFGGTPEDRAMSVQQTTDGGYIIAGSTESYGAGSYNAWLVKIDSSGNRQWDKTFGGTRNDGAYSVQQTTDGGYIIAGSTESYGAGSYDAWLVKTDSSGNEQWNKTFGGTRNDGASSVQQTTDGGYIIAGGTESYGAGSYDAWLIKVKGELREPTEMPITPEPIKPTQMPVTTPTETTPAFEVIFAISGLLAVAYIVKKKKEVL